MLFQNKLAILSTLLPSLGLIGCGDDADYCVLTEESCEEIGAALDEDKCTCVEKNEPIE